MELRIDLETYSSTDIREAGVYAYTAAPDFQILLIGYRYGDGEVNVIDLMDPLVDPVKDFPEFWEGLYNPDVIKTAYNANFERTCLAAWLDAPMPPKQWRCTAVLAATLGLPGTLGGVGKALGLPEDKQKDSTGKRLVEYFCKPCKPTKTNGGRTRNLPEHAPDKWEQFVEYNRQDVVAESTIRDRLCVYPIPQGEQELWNLDQQMNDHGVLLDMDMADKIIRYDAFYRNRLMAEAEKITGLANPNSLAQLKDWLNSSYHLDVTSITKDTIPQIVEELKSTEFMYDIKPALRMLRIRQELGKTSVKKYIAMEKAVCPDGRLRGVLQFYGANRTGRWAGRIVQVHNLPQNKIPDLDLARKLVKAEDFETIEQLFEGIPFVFSQLIRTAFVPSPGCRFVVSDFSAIEARVIAWIADEEWRMEVFRTHGKIYEASASQMFHVPLENVKKGSKLRQQGKVAELACIEEGSLVLTDRGLVPIEKVSDEHQLWDGEKWVSHAGVIFKGEQEVIEYEGLRATPNHFVWIEGEQEPVRFGDAAASGAHLVQTGNGGNALWLGDDYFSGKKMECKNEPLLCSDKMWRMRQCSMAASKQFNKRKIRRMSVLFTAEASTPVVGSEAHIGKTEMRKLKDKKLSQIWRERNTILLSISIGSGIMDSGTRRERAKGLPTGPHKQQWELRTWKSPICRQNKQSGEPKNQRPAIFQTGRVALCKKRCNKKIIQRAYKNRDYCRCAECGSGTEKELAVYRGKAKVYDIRDAGPRHRFTVSGRLVHNCGYGGGFGAIKAMDKDNQIPDEEIPIIISNWRKASPRICRLWYNAEGAAKTAITEHRTVKLKHGLTFSYINRILFVGLPSGRKLAYYDARIEKNAKNRDAITYAGVNQDTKQWGRIETWGGKLVENIVQAAARDCLADTMMRVAAAGYQTVMHVHDEIIVDVPNEDTDALKTITGLMAIPAAWAPELPLRGDGYECNYYKKD